MLARGSLVLIVLCGCAQLQPVAGGASRPALTSSLAGWQADYEEETGGWDVRVGLVVPYGGASLSAGPRFDAFWIKYFKVETYSAEFSVGAYLMADSYWEKAGMGPDPPTDGWVCVVPLTCVGKYYFELIYKSSFKVYFGAGLGLSWAGTLNEPEVQISGLALNVPLRVGLLLKREGKSSANIEVGFDAAGPTFDIHAEPPATMDPRDGTGNLGAVSISMNWKGVF